jgi:superfamily II DNA/RNA helicase
MKFTDLGLIPEYCELIKNLNFHDPTPIQSETISKGILNKDIIAQSKAGTGKTLAYVSIALNKM